MSYAEQTANPVPATSLVTDGGHLIERLSEIHNRLVKLGDAMHGARPRDVGPPAGSKIEPVPTLRRNLDKAQSWVHDIEAELSRIETQL